MRALNDPTREMRIEANSSELIDLPGGRRHQIQIVMASDLIRGPDIGIPTALNVIQAAELARVEARPRDAPRKSTRAEGKCRSRQWQLRAAKDLLDLLIANGFTLRQTNLRSAQAVWLKLEGADAVSPERREQAERVDAVCSDPCGDTRADGFVVGKEVVEHRRNRRPDIAILSKRQGEGDRHGVVPSQPAGVIGEVDGSTRLASPATHHAAIQVDI